MYKKLLYIYGTAQCTVSCVYIQQVVRTVHGSCERLTKEIILKREARELQSLLNLSLHKEGRRDYSLSTSVRIRLCMYSTLNTR